MDDKNIRSLTVLRSILQDRVFGAFIAAKENADEERTAEFINEVLAAGAENNFTAYVCDRILMDENIFSVCCAAGKTPSDYLKNAYLRDIKVILSYIADYTNDNPALFVTGCAVQPFDREGQQLYIQLKKFYKKYGCGQFIKYRAFGFENGELVPVKNPPEITLDDLKGYKNEKNTIDRNIVNFLRGLPYGNMLLYGDRGTGKSSTIHAMLNKYWKNGLRIVELNKENMLDLPKVRQAIMENPLKFIIFIDDLSLNENDDKISGLKAALEGSVSGKTANTMIVATSNRRHIVKENFSDRENSVHFNDSMQEQLSLSDRFGITVMFSSTDKAQYLEIVRNLAADLGLEADAELEALAERWALVKGGRSPRRAKQFVELALSCKKRGIEIDF